MAMFGPYTGDPKKSVSYLYGPHWKGMKGYRVVEGISDYNHRFGGEKWKVPTCKNCGEKYHQIFSFDLNDERLKELKIEGLVELPLISCLNCSTVWEPQLFKIDKNKKEVSVLINNDIHGFIQDIELRIPSPLPEVPVTLVDMKEEDIPIDETTYYEIFEIFGSEYLCRLIGAPLYIQSPIDRECPICHREMNYVATIGSQEFGKVDSLISGVDFFLGEMFLYFLFCKYCSVLKTEVQGT